MCYYVYFVYHSSFQRFFYANGPREEANIAIQYATEQLKVLSRQAIIGNLYPSDHSVMDTTISASKSSH
jgi:hypothetical protein